MLSRFYLIPERRHGQTDRQTDGRTDRQIFYINIARQCAGRVSTETQKVAFVVILCNASYQPFRHDVYSSAVETREHVKNTNLIIIMHR